MTIGKILTGSICTDDAEALSPVFGTHYFKVINTGADLRLVLRMSFQQGSKMRCVFFRYTLFGTVSVQHVPEEGDRVLLAIKRSCVQNYWISPRQGVPPSSCSYLRR